MADNEMDLNRVENAATTTPARFSTMTKKTCNPTDTDHTSTQSLTSKTTLPTVRDRIPQSRLQYLQQSDTQRNTFLYLGYGSNLSQEKFRGDRGIKPLSHVNVQVPTLRLTFDLPGIPYGEPCFANSGIRGAEKDRPYWSEDEKSPLLAYKGGKDRYHKDRWHKGLIGVVYEVTPEDYAHIIETEGGGATYKDITVDCHPLPAGNPDAPVHQIPTLPPFKAHTLFAPAVPPGETPPKDGGRLQRPDPSYAQPSARYLKLITDGARESELPYEYQDYLLNIRPYSVTTSKQRVGAFIFTAIWAPIIFGIFALSKLLADKKGRVPLWLRNLLASVFKSVWITYDAVFKPIFGDGERTMADGGGDEEGGGEDYGSVWEKQRVPETRTMDRITQEEDLLVRQMV